jgi:hypothetical protein
MACKSKHLLPRYFTEFSGGAAHEQGEEKTRIRYYGQSKAKGTSHHKVIESRKDATSGRAFWGLAHRLHTGCTPTKSWGEMPTFGVLN